MSKEAITIRAVVAKDFEQVVDFLRIHFYRDEPMSVCMEPKQERASSVEYTMDLIAHGTCLMAVEQSGDGDEVIIGVILAAPKEPDEAELLFEKAAEAQLPKLRHSLSLLACIERDANVFQRFGVSKALHITIMCVAANQRLGGIARRLTHEIIALGRKLNYPIMTVDCTSVYSTRIFDALGWDCVNVLRYDEYLNSDGKQIFCPPAPHEFVKTYALKL